MKRVLMIIGFGLFLSLALLSFLPLKTQIFPALIFLLITFVVLLFNKKFKLKPILFLSFIISLGCFSLFLTDTIATKNLKDYSETQTTIVGYIDSVDSTGYVCKAEIDGKIRKVYLEDYNTNFELGKPLKVTANLTSVSNLSLGDARTLKSKGCYLLGEKCEYIFLSPSRVSFYPKLKPLIWNFKIELSNMVDKLFSNETAPIFKAVLLGDKTEISPEIKEDFKTSGLNHYTAISGLHTSIIAGAVFLLFRRINKRIGAVISSIVVLGYMALTGFSYSVTRAGIMSIVAFVGLALFLRSDSLTSLGFAITLLLLINPYSSADLGFQLSVLATIGVVVVTPKIDAYLKEKCKNLPFNKIKSFVISAISVTLGANAMLLIHYIFIFNSISIVSPLSNVLASIFMPLPVIFGLISILIFKIPFVSTLSLGLKYLAEIPMVIIIKIANLMSKIPLANIKTGQLFLYVWFILSLALVLYFLITKRKNLIFKTIILSLSSLFVLVLCYNVNNNKNITLTMCNSYNGNAVVVCENNHAFVVATAFDDYTVNSIERTLKSKSEKTLDLLVLENDNKLNLNNFLETYTVKTLCVNEENFPSEYIEVLSSKVENLCGIKEADISLTQRMSIKVRADSRSNLLYYFSLDDVCVGLTKGRFALEEHSNLFFDADILIINDKIPTAIEKYNLSHIFLTNSEYNREFYEELRFVPKNIQEVLNTATVEIRGNSYKVK